MKLETTVAQVVLTWVVEVNVVSKKVEMMMMKQHPLEANEVMRQLLTTRIRVRKEKMMKMAFSQNFDQYYSYTRPRNSS